MDGPLTASLCQNEVVADLKDRRSSVDQIIRIVWILQNASLSCTG
jgi:transposase